MESNNLISNNLENEQNRKFPCFDFENTHYLNLFRIICAFSVILLHIHMFGETQVKIINNCYFLSFIKDGLAPVGFFFLLSGFLFNKIYFKKIVDKKLTGKQFWISKFVKFFPFTLITTIIFFMLSLIAKYGLNISLTRGSTRLIDLLLGIFLGGGEIFIGDYTVLNAALWYINILIFVYVVVFALTCLYRKLSSKFLFAIPLLLGFGMGFLKEQLPFFNILFGRGLFNFFLGFFIFELANKLSRLNKKGAIITRAICLLLVGVYLFGFYYFNKVRKDPTFLHYMDFGIANFLFWIPLMFLLNGKTSNKIAENKIINASCNLTFDIYIWHQIVFAIIEIIVVTSKIEIKNGVLYFFVINFSVLFISILSYLFLDKPIINKAKQFTRV